MPILGQSQLEKFPRTYNASGFNHTADLAILTGKWNKVGYVTVPAQQFIAFGGGQIAGGVDSRETATLKLYVAGPTQKHGVFRLAIANANETRIRIIKEDRSENFSAGVKLAETTLRAKEDSLLIVYFNPDADFTIDFDAVGATWLLPVTVYQ